VPLWQFFLKLTAEFSPLFFHFSHCLKLIIFQLKQRGEFVEVCIFHLQISILKKNVKMGEFVKVIIGIGFLF